MATPLANGIVLKVLKIYAPYPGLDESGLGLHAEESDLINRLHVLNGVPGAHEGIAVAAPGKNLHVKGLFKFCKGGRFTHPCVAQRLPARSLLHCLGNDLVGTCHGIALVKIKGTCSTALDLPKEGLLQLGHVLLYGLFCSTLHSAVYGRVDFEAVGVEVVFAAVGLAVGRNPLLHVLANVFAQVGSQTLVVPPRGKVDFYRQGLEGVGLFFGKEAAFFHLTEHGIAAVHSGLFLPLTGRVVNPRALAHSYKHSRLLDVEFCRHLAEVDVGRVVNAYPLVQKVKLVEVHRNKFLLGIAGLQLH